MKEPGGARREDLFDARERAVLRFATLLTAHPGSVEPRDLDELGEHLSAQEAFELVWRSRPPTGPTASTMGSGPRSPDPDGQLSARRGC